MNTYNQDERPQAVDFTQKNIVNDHICQILWLQRASLGYLGSIFIERTLVRLSENRAGTSGHVYKSHK